MKNYTLKIYRTSGKIETIRTRKKKRFFRILRTINWQDGVKKTYLKVSYDKKICNFGCLCEFYNDGWYFNKEDLMWAYRAFDAED